MIKHTQSKVVVRNSANEIIVHGNCFQTTVACMLDMNPADVPNVEVLFDIPDSALWWNVMFQFLKSKGYEINNDHRYKVFHDSEHLAGTQERLDLIQELRDKYYMVTGLSSRGVNHCCIFQNGKMVWDCHPTREGLIDFRYFETIDSI